MTLKQEIDLQLIFDSLNSSNQEIISKKLDILLSKIYGLLLMFIDDEITPQQKAIWLMLCSNHPKSHSGLEIAESIGASKISKGIYSSIRALERLNLINVDSSHPRIFSVTANRDHKMTKALMDLSSYYGN